MQVCLQIVKENVSKNDIKVTRIVDDNNENVTNEFSRMFNEVSGVKILYEEILKNDLIEDKQLDNADLVITKNLAQDEEVNEVLQKLLGSKSYVINLNLGHQSDSSASYNIISSFDGAGSKIELIRFNKEPTSYGTVITVNSKNDLNNLCVQISYIPVQHGLLIFAKPEMLPELKEKVQKWKSQHPKTRISVVVIDKPQDTELCGIPDLANCHFKDGVWGGEFLVPWEDTKDTSSNQVILKSGSDGDLESLQWVHGNEPEENGIKVTVHYAGFTDDDVKKATGILPLKDGSDPKYGMDFSGVTESGKQVMGLIKDGAASSQVIANPDLLWDVPEGWSLEDASTVPYAYSFAFYCLPTGFTVYSIIRALKLKIKRTFLI